MLFGGKLSSWCYIYIFWHSMYNVQWNFSKDTCFVLLKKFVLKYLSLVK